MEALLTELNDGIQPTAAELEWVLSRAAAAAAQTARGVWRNKHEIGALDELRAAVALWYVS